MVYTPTAQSLAPVEAFAQRHIGPNDQDVAAMLATLGYESLEALIEAVVPADIRRHAPLDVPPALSETEALAVLRQLAQRNQVWRSYLGMGYAACITPAVIQRNILENPGWYTQYTPYQAEIAQGRLEALLNFQTLITELTGLAIANASLLDEATAAAEAMTLSRSVVKKGNRYLVSAECHPQTISVVQTRAEPLGIEVCVADPLSWDFTATPVFGVLLPYPTTSGAVLDYRAVTAAAHDCGALVTYVADLLALVLLESPGALGADIAVGSSQRFGVPLGFGGPHAAFFATKQAYARMVPGRIVGVSQDSQGNPAYRLALQTREQHIRREKATSNICTAQVLLAVVASMYAVYHGSAGLKRIAERIHGLTLLLAQSLQGRYRLRHTHFFDTLCVALSPAEQASVRERAAAKQMNLRYFADGAVGISLDETTRLDDLKDLCAVFDVAANLSPAASPLTPRQDAILRQPAFNRYHSESELLRYMFRLQSKDLSLTTAMIPLGSCTMKLNATAEMLPISWPEFAQMHPYAPAAQIEGYQELCRQLEQMLAEITGFAAVSLQPNAGSQGEYAGLLAIRAYHRDRDEGHRTICLIPQSAHGTNPASAVMAGMKVVSVACDDQGNIDLVDLQAKASQHQANLAALMVTYPSTHGVFEASIRQICAIAHEHGAQVYMDGANLNAQVGLCRPGDFGADVCHLNLHKTFCIPHGGGGPGVGPIAVGAHLAPFLPGNPQMAGSGAVAAAPWGSASILPISWMYIRMMGADGLRRASEIAILSANYMAKVLEPYYSVLYRGNADLVAHECILDLRPWKRLAGLEVEDVAKRLMDYGFHAPTMSWPVAGTLMLEPTESETKAELDRFCAAMVGIYREMTAIQAGAADPQDNLLKNAPHTAAMVTASTWQHPYSREEAAYPQPQELKFWPAVARVDNAYGDRNLVCTCAPLEDYA